MNKILVGHLVTPSGKPDPANGGTFVCTAYDTARNFNSVEQAQAYIDKFLVSPDWKVFVLAEVPR